MCQLGFHQCLAELNNSLLNVTLLYEHDTPQYEVCLSGDLPALLIPILSHAVALTSFVFSVLLL